jgi:hypothetical protein
MVLAVVATDEIPMTDAVAKSVVPIPPAVVIFLIVFALIVAITPSL